jgi:hypothetical protein
LTRNKKKRCSWKNKSRDAHASTGKKQKNRQVYLHKATQVQ